MYAVKSIEELNRELGDQVLEDAKRNPRKYAGRYVGLANGNLVGAADTLKDIVARLMEVEPVPANCYILDLHYDYSKPYYIREFC
jgi:hypothetical protein